MSVWILRGGFDRDIKSHYGKEIIYDLGGYANQAVETIWDLWSLHSVYVWENVQIWYFFVSRK